MHAREIRKGIHVIATVHWERRLFDSLIPLPDGTSYNAYLVRGSEATALLDSTDLELCDDLCTGGPVPVQLRLFRVAPGDHRPLCDGQSPRLRGRQAILCRNAAHLANLLRPKLKYAAIIGSYGWNSKTIETISELIPNLKVDVLGTVLHKGAPTAATYAQLDKLAATVAKAHKNNDNVISQS